MHFIHNTHFVEVLKKLTIKYNENKTKCSEKSQVLKEEINVQGHKGVYFSHLLCVCVWSLHMYEAAPNLSQLHLPVFFAGLLKRHSTRSKR